MTVLKSPFRYPGGKSKISNKISDIIRNSYEEYDNFIFVDVFTGGGSVSLKIAEDFINSSLVLNDLDEWMYYFWKQMADGSNEVNSYIDKHNPPTVYDFQKWRVKSEGKSLTDAQKAFIALFFNRTAFSGIFKSGPIGGYSQGGNYKIDSRYNSNRLTKIVNNIVTDFINRDVSVYRFDFREVISMYGNDIKNVLYLDPPYMKEGKQLYNHFMKYDDYADMAYMLSKSKCNWIVSHNDHPDFVEMYEGWTNITSIEGFPYTINSIKGKKRVELLITNMETPCHTNP